MRSWALWNSGPYKWIHFTQKYLCIGTCLVGYVVCFTVVRCSGGDIISLCVTYHIWCLCNKLVLIISSHTSTTGVCCSIAHGCMTTTKCTKLLKMLCLLKVLSKLLLSVCLYISACACSCVCVCMCTCVCACVTSLPASYSTLLWIMTACVWPPGGLHRPYWWAGPWGQDRQDDEESNLFIRTYGHTHTLTCNLTCIHTSRHYAHTYIHTYIHTIHRVTCFHSQHCWIH